jgi:adenosylcobinamide-GDP ribazoletransferase
MRADEHHDEEPRTFHVRAFFRGVRAAAALLTRIPVGGFPYDDEERRWSAAHLPLIGALVGWLGAIAWAATSSAGPLVSAVVAVATAIALTGALHEDGLADTADALGGGDSRERVFAILKDHNIGAFGACALVLGILLRVAALERLGPDVPSICCFVSAASRLGPAVLVAALPYVTPAATAKNASLATAGFEQAAVAAAWVGAVGAAAHEFGGLPWSHALGSIASGALTVAACGAYFRKRVGGVTGDFLGATQQLSECAMLLTFALVHGNH